MSKFYYFYKNKLLLLVITTFDRQPLSIHIDSPNILLFSRIVYHVHHLSLVLACQH